MRFTRNRILIVVLAIVLLAPLFEVFDHSADMEQGNDFVLALLFMFVATSLFLLCKRMVSFLFRLSFMAATISPVSVRHAANRSIEASASPPQSFLSLGSLRI
jgi:hypothetical protein